MIAIITLCGAVEASAACPAFPTGTNTDDQVVAFLHDFNNPGGLASLHSLLSIGLATVAEGHLIYNRTSKVLQLCNDTAWLTLASSAIAPAGNDGSIQFKFGATLAADATNLHWDDTNKRLGIGTSGPAAPLTVIGNGTSYGILLASSLNGDGIFISTANATTNNGLVWNQGANSMFNLFSNTSNDAFFHMYSANTSRGFISTAGNTYFTGGDVGIGLTGPARILHVSGTSAVVRIQDSGAAGAAAIPFLEFHDSAGTRIGLIGDTTTANTSVRILSDAGSIIAQAGANTCTYTSGAAWTCTSDARMKDKITPLEGALSDIVRLHGVTYHWKDPAKARDRHIGLIAQDVEKIYPDLVTMSEDGMKALDYSGLIAPLIEAVKELKAANDNQALEIKKLRNELDQIKTAR